MSLKIKAWILFMALHLVNQKEDLNTEGLVLCGSEKVLVIPTKVICLVYLQL